MLRKIFLLIISVLIISGCVSKKKYVALEKNKDRIAKQLKNKEAENKKLESDLKSAVADYEDVKYKLSRSNAIKSDDISDLIGRTTSLQDKVDDLTAQLNKIKNDLNYNKNSYQKTADDLQKTKTQLMSLQKDTASLHYSIKLARERNDMLTQELSATKKKYNDLYAEYSLMQDKIDNKDIQMKTLEKQLIDQKEKIEAISKNFIGLRKQLLEAETKGKPINPNKNSTINKIAKLLGHY
jgi:chromosome segregation ATPase